MTRNPPRSAKSNAGDRKGVSENASRDALSGRIGLFGRAIRPARSTTRIGGGNRLESRLRLL